jgi:uroporphyrinogen decarboxylase
MHKDDLMTPLERSNALAQGEKPDRMPIALGYGSAAGDLLGLVYDDFREKPALRAEVLINAYNEFGYDGVGVTYDTDALVGLFGGELCINRKGPNSVSRPPVTDLNDLSMLDLELVGCERDYSWHHTEELFHRLQDALGNEIRYIGFGIEAPLTLAARFAGTTYILRAIKRTPSLVRPLLEFFTELVIKVHAHFIPETGSVTIYDAVSSGSLISPQMYDEFSMPYEKRIIDALKEKRPDVSVHLHICGNTLKNMPSMAGTGANIISMDDAVKLETAKKLIGNQVLISGNVSPMDVIYHGTPEDIDREIRACFAEAYDSPRGFGISAGCAIAPGTPIANMRQFMATARECAGIHAQQEDLSPGSFWRNAAAVP